MKHSLLSNITMMADGDCFDLDIAPDHHRGKRDNMDNINNMNNRPEIYIYEFKKHPISKDEFMNITESEGMFAWFLESLASKGYESEAFKMWFRSESLCMLFKPTGVLIEVFYEEKTLHDAKNPDFRLEVVVNRRMNVSDFRIFLVLLQLDLDGLLDDPYLMERDVLREYETIR